MASPSSKKILRNIHIAVVALGMVLLAGSGLVTVAVRGGFQQAVAPDSLQTTGSELPESIGNQIVDGKDLESGLIAVGDYLVVKRNCSGCHSTKLITQNHLSRDRWEQSIRWMQKNQNLGDLGLNEPIILDYLAKYYGPLKQGRRKPLEQPKWYPLK